MTERKIPLPTDYHTLEEVVEPPLDYTENPSLTARQRLDETSYRLVTTLRELIDAYGFKGVEQTLKDILEVGDLKT